MLLKGPQAGLADAYCTGGLPFPPCPIELINRLSVSSVSNWAAESWVIFSSNSERRLRASRASRTPMAKARLMSARIARPSRRISSISRSWRSGAAIWLCSISSTLRVRASWRSANFSRRSSIVTVIQWSRLPTDVSSGLKKRRSGRPPPGSPARPYLNCQISPNAARHKGL